MKNIEILDCTLRDGGRIINCEFSDEAIIGIGKQLLKSGIDIIEIGFLRDNIQYKGNSTFFPSIMDADVYVRKTYKDNTKEKKIVLFVDYGLYDLNKLQEAEKNKITGIRFGFKKRDFENDKEGLIQAMEIICQKGYELYFQDVNTNGYTEDELIEVIQIANEVNPVSFGIVDTYGSMYLDDLEAIWSLVNEHLKENIKIDFHSHNNMQMSFALTQRLIQLAEGKRALILDATLNGMGKCAGNLNTELIVDFLARKRDYDYEVDMVLDAIDRYLLPIKKSYDWGYSIPAFMAGVYKAHPNNVIYLTEKYRLNSKDIKYIISGIDEKTRQSYDYSNIHKVYKDYCSSKIDDELTMQELAKIFTGKMVLAIAPGRTVRDYEEKLVEYIKSEKPIVVCINFMSKKFAPDFLFYANTIHWERVSDMVDKSNCILSSNIHSNVEDTFLVNYSRLIMEDSVLYDNSTIMLLNLLKNLNVSGIMLAGFDGLREDNPNYINDTFPDKKSAMSCEKINLEIKKLFIQFQNKVKGEIELGFLTPSIYEEIS